MKVEGADEDDFGAGRYCRRVSEIREADVIKFNALLMCSSVLLQVRFMLGYSQASWRPGCEGIVCCGAWPAWFEAYVCLLSLYGNKKAQSRKWSLWPAHVARLALFAAQMQTAGIGVSRSKSRVTAPYSLYPRDNIQKALERPLTVEA